MTLGPAYMLVTAASLPGSEWRRHLFEFRDLIGRKIPVPRYMHHADRVACHAQLGYPIEADTKVAKAIRLRPTSAIEEYLANLLYREAADRDHHRQSLLQAGFPA